MKYDKKSMNRLMKDKRFLGMMSRNSNFTRRKSFFRYIFLLIGVLLILQHFGIMPLIYSTGYDLYIGLISILLFTLL